jgi:hypothetical protein
VTDHGPDGKFCKGNKAGPGRPPKALDENFKALIDVAVTPEDWNKIITTAMKQAIRGDTQAREWLTNRRFGKVPDKQELTGRDGGPVEITEIAYELTKGEDGE